MKIGQIIKDILYHSEMSQRDLAKELVVTPSTINRLRNNLQLPRLETAKKLMAFAKKYKMDIKIENITL